MMKTFSILTQISICLASSDPKIVAEVDHDPQEYADLKSCVFEVTEHFVLQKDDSSARMPLSSSQIFQSILNHLDFLDQLQPNFTIQADGQWIAQDTFQNIFRYSQLLKVDSFNFGLCNSFLFIKSDNASVCKAGQEIRFSAKACSALVNGMIKFNNWPDNSFEESLSKVPSGKMYTYVENDNGEILFPNVNSMTDYCKAVVDPDFRAALQNIFVSSAVMFQSYEKLLETFFPEPPCQKLTFTLPDSILPGLHFMKNFQGF